MHNFFDLVRLDEFDRNILILHRQAENESSYTYKEVSKEAQLVLKLFQHHKIPQKSGIALKLVAHTPGSCVLLLSILNHGCRFCPLSLKATREATAKQSQEAGAHFLISHNVETPNYKLLFKIVIFGEECYYLSRVEISPLLVEGQYCYSINTTGSTGVPKMVHVPLECIRPNVEGLSKRLNISVNDVVLLHTPFTFDPFVIEFFVALYNGAALLIISADLRLKTDQWLRALFPKQETLQRSVTIMQMTPSLFRLFGVSEIKQTILQPTSALRALLLGGEEFPSMSELKTWLPTLTRIFNIYGITELSCWSTISEYGDYVHQEVARMPLGEPIDSTTKLRVLKADGEILHGSGQGELQVGSATRKCYIPQETISEDGVLYRNTGDLVERDGVGRIFYIGRLNNVIKRWGKRLCLGALNKRIETILNESYLQAVCLWDAGITKLSCFLKCADVSLSKQALYKLKLNEELEDYEKPDQIICLRNMPLNAHSKIDCRALMNTREDRSQKSPSDMFKKFLNEVLVLNLTFEPTNMHPAVKRTKNAASLSFTANGGTSFQALSLATEIGEQLAEANDQKKLLEMLLAENTSLRNINAYLETVKCKNTQVLKKLSSHQFCTRKLHLQWRANLRKCIDAAPASISQKYICVGSHAHLLRTFNAGDGSVVATMELPDRIECKVAYIEQLPELALVGCYDENVYMFNYMSGEICWRLNVGGLIKAQPLIIDSKAFVASYATDFNLLCLEIKTREILWRLKIGYKGIYAAPLLLEQNAILVCTLDGSYARIDSVAGKVMWLQKFATPIFSTPVLLDNNTRIAVAEVCGKLHICSASSGELLHSFEAGGNIFSSIILFRLPNSNDTLLLFGCHDEHLYALQYAHDLKLLWKTHLHAAIFSTPTMIVHESVPFVITCTTKGLLTLLEAESGRLAAKYDLQAEIFSTSCCLATDRIYFGCRDNYLYCFSIKR